MEQKNEAQPTSIANKRVLMNLVKDDNTKIPEEKDIELLRQRIDEQGKEIDFLRKAVCILINVFIFGLGNYFYNKKARYAVTFATCFYGFVAFAILGGYVSTELFWLLLIPAAVTFLFGQLFIISERK